MGKNHKGLSIKFKPLSYLDGLLFYMSTLILLETNSVKTTNLRVVQL